VGGICERSVPGGILAAAGSLLFSLLNKVSVVMREGFVSAQYQVEYRTCSSWQPSLLTSEQGECGDVGGICERSVPGGILAAAGSFLFSLLNKVSMVMWMRFVSAQYQVEHLQQLAAFSLINNVSEGEGWRCEENCERSAPGGDCDGGRNFERLAQKIMCGLIT
jgi:hypothetical protein